MEQEYTIHLTLTEEEVHQLEVAYPDTTAQVLATILNQVYRQQGVR
jgi:hypothetical protein